MPCTPTTGEAGEGLVARGCPCGLWPWGRAVQSPQLTATLPVLSPLLAFPWPWVWGTDLCSSQRECPLAADELSMVQTALLELVLELLTPISLAEDLQVVLSFLAAAGDAGQVSWRPVTGRLGRGRGVDHVGRPSPV